MQIIYSQNCLLGGLFEHLVNKEYIFYIIKLQLLVVASTKCNPKNWLCQIYLNFKSWDAINKTLCIRDRGNYSNMPEWIKNHIEPCLNSSSINIILTCANFLMFVCIFLQNSLSRFIFIWYNILKTRWVFMRKQQYCCFLWQQILVFNKSFKSGLFRLLQFSE